jgi:hypothetical protein
MPELPEPPPPVLLDACCAINLLATGIAEEILAANTVGFAVARLVLEEEVLHVRDEGKEGDTEGSATKVALQPLVAQGLLTVLAPESDEELATFCGTGPRAGRRRSLDNWRSRHLTNPSATVSGVPISSKGAGHSRRQRHLIPFTYHYLGSGAGPMSFHSSETPRFSYPG